MGIAWDASKYLPRVSAMNQLMTGFNFVVTLNEFVFGFQSVSGFSIEKGTDIIPSGGVNDHGILVGKPTQDQHTLTFKRGYLIRHSSLVSSAARAAAAAIPNNSGRKAALLALNMTDPQEALESGPALGTIEVFDGYRNLRAMYSFFSLGMTSWRMDDLDATASSIVYEEITIAHTGLIRHALAPPFTQTAMSIVDAVNNVETSRADENYTDQVRQSQAKTEAEQKKQEMEKLKKEEETAKRELQKDTDQLSALENELAALEGV